MADVSYEPSKAGWAEIAMSPEMLAACVREAERGMAFAVGISPRSGDDDGDDYVDAFDVHGGVAHEFRRGPRVRAVLVNGSGHAAAVEYGNKRQPDAHRVIGRTAAYLGGG